MKFLNVLITLSLLWFAGCQESKHQNNDAVPVNPFTPKINFATYTASTPYINANILLTFLHEVNASTLSATSVILTDANGTAIPAALSANGKTIIIDPTSDLATVTKHTLTLTTQLELIIDGASKALDQNRTYDFTTTYHSDNTPANVTGSYPKNGDTNVSVHTAIVYSFSKNMDTSKIPTATINGQTANVMLSNNNLLIRPIETLAFSTVYSVSISGVYDLANNAFSDSFSFTTQAGPSLISTFSSSYPTLGYGFSSGHDFYAMRADFNTSAERLYVDDLGTVTPDFYTVYNPVGTPPTAASAYDNGLFVAYGNRITTPYDAWETNRTVDFNISSMATQKERACLLSSESGSINLYAIYELSGFNFYEPLSVTSGVNPKTCLIKDNIAHATTDNTLYIYDLTNPQSIATNTLADTNLSGLALTADKLYAISGTSVKEYSRTNPLSPSFVRAIDFNVTLGTIFAFDDYLFASEQNGTRLFIANVASAPKIIHTITASAPIGSFAVGEEELMIFHTPDQAITESVYDLSAIFFVNRVDLALTHAPYKIKSHYDTLVIADGNGATLLLPDKTFKTFTTPGTAISATIYDDYNLGKFYLFVADSDHGVAIFDVNGSTATPITTISPVEGNFSRVYDVHAISDMQTLILGTDNGVRIYDINDSTAPQLLTSMSEQNFGTVMSVDAVPFYDPIQAGSSVYGCFADYSNQKVSCYTFISGPTDYTQTFSIDTTTPPRHVIIEPMRGHVFAALGSGGILAVDANNSTNNVELKTPGFAMQVAPMHDYAYEDNVPSTIFDLVVADYTGLALVSYQDDGTSMSHVHLSSFIPQEGAIYGFTFNLNGDGVSINRTHSKLTFFGGGGGDYYYYDPMLTNIGFIPVDYAPPADFY